MDRGEWVDRAEGNRAALTRYEKEVLPGTAVSGQDSERRRINRLQERPIARTALTRLGDVEVADYIREREAEGVSPNTIRLELATISHVYTVAGTAWGMPYLINPVPLAKTARPRCLPAGTGV